MRAMAAINELVECFKTGSVFYKKIRKIHLIVRLWGFGEFSMSSKPAVCLNIKMSFYQ